jgi:hypothetical protein
LCGEIILCGEILFCDWHDSPRSDSMCAELPLEAGLICLLGGTEGVSERRCRMGFGVAGNYWRQGQNAFSDKQIGELLRFVAQGTGADEWAGFCFRAEFKLKYFVCTSVL